MKFRTVVEPPEPMRGLEVPPELVESFGAGKRPPVRITVNGHTWRSRVAVMRGRYLLGLSNANRQASGVAIGDEVEVELQLDTEPRTVATPDDLAAALDAAPAARAAFDALTDSQKRQHIREVEAAKKPETRARRVEKVVRTLTASRS